MRNYLVILLLTTPRWYLLRLTLMLDHHFGGKLTHHFIWSESNYPTHIPPNSSSCIDLIFTNLYKPNLFTEKVLYLSLHRKCHHRITFSKLNLKATAQWPSQDFKGDLDTDYIWVFISFYVNTGIGGPKKPNALFPGVG